MRAYELAKELGLEPKKLIDFAKMRGIAFKSNLSIVSEEAATQIRTAVASVRAMAAAMHPPAPKEAPAAARPAEPVAPPKVQEAAAQPEPVVEAPAPPKPAEVAPPHKAPPKPKPKPKPEAEIKLFRPPKSRGEPFRIIKPETPAVRAPADKTKVAPLKEPDKAKVDVEKLVPIEEVEAGPAIVRKPRFRTVRFKKQSRPSAPPPPPKPREGKIEVPAPVTVKSLSSATGIKASEIITKLMQKGVMATINHVLEQATAEEICLEHDIELVITKPKDLEEEVLEQDAVPDQPDDLVPRPPVVTMLGHVDHGKTSLLDRIRKTNVAATEAGGITQHMGAYTAEIGGHKVVFLDTPGHEAFTAMRARGANATDIAVLVVAADDGVMPQTEEAISHAKAAEVKIVVALNKIDKPNANPAKCMQQLAAAGVNPEQWGGDTGIVPVSAITGQGIEDLIERLSLEAEILELKANPKRAATGIVLEAGISEGRGVEATMLVRDGTLHRGDFVLSGKGYGTVRSISDWRGKTINEAGPASPVVVSGLSEMPEAGDTFHALTDPAKARKIAEDRKLKQWRAGVAQRQSVTLENLFSRIEEGKVKDLKLIVKADTKGSLEVLTAALSKQATSEARTVVLHNGIGGINESDVLLANASGGIILGFHVVPEEKARVLAEERDVEVRLYKVIYELFDDVHKALEGMLEPEKREVVLGHAQIRQLFKISKLGTIAGCYVPDGKILRNAQIRVTRDSVVIYEGRLASLKREKEDVREVVAGFECGLHVEGFDDIKAGDVVEAFEIQRVKRTLA